MRRSPHVLNSIPMRHFKYFFIIVCNLVLLSCDNEVDLIHVSESTPVIYLVFNPNSQNYYLTLTKSVVGTENAINLIKNPDLVFYNQATVLLNGLEKDSILFSLEFNKSVSNKEPGIFAQSSGYLFESEPTVLTFNDLGLIDRPYHKLTSFELIVIIPESSDTLHSKIDLIKPDRILKPRRQGIKVDLAPPNSFIAQLWANTDNSYYKQLNFSFFYDELIDSVVYQRCDKLKMVSYIRDDNLDKIIDISFDGTHFLNVLSAQVTPPSPKVIWRKPRKFDFSIVTVDQAFKNYQETYQYSSEGISMIWSNVSGGSGLFAHYVSSTQYGYKFNQRTIDSIALSSTTKHLKFIRWE